MSRSIGLVAAASCLLFAAVPTAAQTTSQQPQYPSLRIGGFSDFNFQATDEKTAAPTSGFREGQFVLHFTSALAPRFSFFAEMTLTAHTDAFGAEIERTILKFQANDMLGLSFGRYHTPINWWNVAFHHGQWLQTSINRPEMTKFGGVFIPVHFVGAVASGVLPASGVDLDYELGVGNGRSEPPSRAGDAGDVNNNRAWFGTLSATPDRFYKLEVGGAYYHDLAGTVSAGDFDEQIVSAHAVWSRETPELIGEIAYSRHASRVTSSAYENWAGYVQAAYRLPWWRQQLKPYARFERLDIADDPSNPDPVFAGRISDLDEYTAGLRWDCSDFVALKGEYRRQEYEKVNINALLLQISFAF
jgi:hypothetical protein